MIRWIGLAAAMTALAVAVFVYLGLGAEQTGRISAGVAELALPSPPAKPDLIIFGAIARGNATFKDRQAITLDLAALRALPQQTIATTTSWTDGTDDFTGPLLRDVLAFAGSSGKKLTATAVNDYFVTIPVIDASKYDVILAHEMNGEPLQRSDKGPLWVVYPEADYPELRDPLYNGRWIWQLKTIEVF